MLLSLKSQPKFTSNPTYIDMLNLFDKSGPIVLNWYPLESTAGIIVLHLYTGYTVVGEGSICWQGNTNIWTDWQGSFL